jgi:hypothetical protein
MPRRNTTRAQDRAKRIAAERARNQEISEQSANPIGNAYSLSRPPPDGETDDRPPF